MESNLNQRISDSPVHHSGVCTGECSIKTAIEAFLSLLSVSFYLTTGGFVYAGRRSGLARSFMVTVNGARPRSSY